MSPSSLQDRATAFLAGGGEMGVLIRAHDWAAHPLGPPVGWPQPLRTALRLILNTGHPAYVFWGEPGYCFYNDAYRPSIGRERHPGSIGRPARAVWEEIWGVIGPQIEQVMTGLGATWHEDQLLPITRDGRRDDVYWTYSYGPIDDDGAPSGVGGVLVLCAETTRQVTAERRMRGVLAGVGETEERLRLAVDNAEVGFWDVDPVAGTLVWPARTKALFGISPDVAVSMDDFYEGLHPDDRDATSAAYAAAIDPDARALYDVEYRTVGKEDGVVRWVAAKGRGIFDVDGRCVRVAGTAVDISARKAAEAALLDLNETLEARVAERTAALEAAHEQLRQSQKLEAMGSLTGGVAHDFNNLLTPIVGALDMLQRQALGGERERRLIAGAAQSAERARMLVQRLLAFARRQPLQPVALDLGQLVRNMADLVASTTGPQIAVSVEVAEGLPPAMADANQLEMALLNLSVNARDAMPDGGALTIGAEAETGERAGLAPGHYLCLSVADTGAGMDEATLARAVEPFFSTKGVGKGTGLGLSMAHGLASQLGGALTIASEPGRGTRVELWLPATDALPAIGAEPHAEPIRGRGTALLVDDEELVRLSTADMLGDLGYHVVQAASAREALLLIAADAPVDLVVTDHLMPGMTGTELALALRERRRELPVLVVSGYAEVEGIAPDLPRLAKPFRKDELAASLAGLTGAPHR